MGIAPGGLVQEPTINLINSANPANVGLAPVGVAIGPNVTYNGTTGDIVVVANRNSRNVSVIFARADPTVPSSTPIPSVNPSTPAGSSRTFLPLAQK